MKTIEMTMSGVALDGIERLTQPDYFKKLEAWKLSRNARLKKNGWTPCELCELFHREQTENAIMPYGGAMDDRWICPPCYSSRP